MKLFFKAPVRMRSAALRTYVARRARFAFGRFDDAVQSATVVFEEIDRPKGGIDKRCCVRLRIPGEPEIIVQAIHDDSYAAADLAMSKARRALLRRSEQHPVARRPLRGVAPALAAGRMRSSEPVREEEPS